MALHVVVGSTGSPYLELVSSPLNLEFALGVAVGLAVVTGWIIRPGLFLAVGVAAVAAVWVRLGSSGWTEFPSTTYRLLGPGVAMAFVVYGAVGVELRRRVVCPAWLQRLGDASYSLYLVHVPAITALGLVLVRWTPDTPWAHAVVLVAVPLYVVGLARLSYVLVERPVQRFFRRWPRSRRDAQPDRHPAPAPVVQRGLDSSLPQIGDMEPVRPDERQRPGTLAARG
jgi:exopolysaccharide production protein ExoZ